MLVLDNEEVLEIGELEFEPDFEFSDIDKIMKLVVQVFV